MTSTRSEGKHVMSSIVNSVIPPQSTNKKYSQNSSCNRCTFELHLSVQMRRKNSICVSSMRKEQLCQLGATSVTAHAPLFASLNTHIHTSHISSNESCNGRAGMLQLPYLLQSIYWDSGTPPTVAFHLALHILYITLKLLQCTF